MELTVIFSIYIYSASIVLIFLLLVSLCVNVNKVNFLTVVILLKAKVNVMYHFDAKPSF